MTPILDQYLCATWVDLGIGVGFMVRDRVYIGAVLILIL